MNIKDTNLSLKNKMERTLKKYGIDDSDVVEAMFILLEKHFNLREIDLDVGDLKIISDNTSDNTKVVCGCGEMNGINSIEWELTAGPNAIGQLTLRLV